MNTIESAEVFQDFNWKYEIRRGNSQGSVQSSICYTEYVMISVDPC